MITFDGATFVMARTAMATIYVTLCVTAAAWLWTRFWLEPNARRKWSLPLRVRRSAVN